MKSFNIMITVKSNLKRQILGPALQIVYIQVCSDGVVVDAWTR